MNQIVADYLGKTKVSTEADRSLLLQDFLYHLCPHGVVIGGLYRHFKGGYYRLRFVAENSDTLEREVVYQNTATGDVYTRKLAEFLGSVSKDGYEGPRFKYVGD
jgi:hypothetical protein